VPQSAMSSRPGNAVAASGANCCALPDFLFVSPQAYEVANRLDLVGPSVEQPEYNLFERKKVTALFYNPPSLPHISCGMTTRMLAAVTCGCTVSAAAPTWRLFMRAGGV
jgi:hypothetical protein